MLKELKIKERLNLEQLCSKLRNVKLKGFPYIQVYEESDFKIRKYDKNSFTKEIYTPQPEVYQKFLDRLFIMADIFSKEGIDIFSLEEGIDYIAFDENGEESNWTILPPLIESQKINFANNGSITYQGIIGNDLLNLIDKEKFIINQDYYKSLDPTKKSKFLPVICDGSHRIEAAFQLGREINVLLVSNIKEGFPYYAVPRPYSEVQVLSEWTESTSTKIHVLEAPGHKALYRLFPTAELYTGGVRRETLKK